MRGGVKNKFPCKELIRETRAAANLGRAQAASLVHVGYETWVKWEQGRNRMQPAFFELFCVKTGQPFHGPKQER